MADHDEPHGEDFAEAADMLEQFEQSLRESAKAAAGTPLEANHIAAADRARAEREGLTQAQVDAWNAPSDPAPIRERAPGDQDDLTRGRLSNGRETVGGYSEDTDEGSERVQGEILRTLGCAPAEIQEMGATVPRPGSWTVNGELPVLYTPSSDVMLTIPRSRVSRRPREQRAGRGHTQARAPDDDDPHHQPAGRPSQRSGRENDSGTPHVIVPPGWTPIQVVWHISRLLISEPREHWHMAALHERRGDFLAFESDRRAS